MEHSEDLYSDMFADHEIEPESRTVKDTFSPWHHPRKQYIRKEQWVKIISRNLDDITEGVKNLNYFGLPGDDLLDIREIHDSICQNNQIELRFTGFNEIKPSEEARHVNANLSLAEVKGLQYIQPSSEVVNVNTKNIGRTDSLAYQKAYENSPYDIINLDYCGSITSDNPNASSETDYDSIAQLLHMQSSRKKPWLFYITTRIGKNHIHKETLRLLIECYKANMTSTLFSEKSDEYFNVKDDVSLSTCLDNECEFNKIIITSFCKWLLNNALRLTPKFSIKIESIIEYKVCPQSENPDMISLALRFNPKIGQLNDCVGLARTIDDLDEPTIASRFLPKVNAKLDCDSLLNQNAEVFDTIIGESIELLKKARYDITNYRAHFNCN